jgi:hypothetical protein
MTLMRKTWAASIRWLSLTELKDSRLATLALDPAEPIMTSGANGLNAKAFDGDPPRADLMQASLVTPVADATRPSQSRSAIFGVAARSRRRRSSAVSRRRRRRIRPLRT